MILRRLPDSRFSEVVKEWAGETVVLIGGGPSLTQEQVARVCAAREACRVRVIAVNDAYLWAPFADVCYFADSHWWVDHNKGTPKPELGLTADQVRLRFSAFSGQKCTIQNSGGNVTDDAVHMLRNKHFPDHGDGHGLSIDPQALVTGRHGGFQVLNLATLAGGTTGILLGYDGKPSAEGKTHWSGGHPRPTPVAAYAEYRRSFSAAENAIKAAGVKVINCTPGSAIDSFPKMPLEEALCEATA